MAGKLLVVGAREGSLGAGVVQVAEASGLYSRVGTAGISGDEERRLNITRLKDVYAFLREEEWDHVVCTAGMNLPGTITGQDWHANMKSQMNVNYQGPMNLLSEWARYWRKRLEVQPDEKEQTRHFVAVSSNSAHIARSGSGGYCASKAALSMGVRCAARELDRDGWPLVAYGYEPGWLNGTPMSNEIESAISGPLHRIPSGQGLHPVSLAALIVNNLSNMNQAISGCMIRVDGGEQ